MEKPHYKQPITADNIETALQFYLEQTPEIKYKLEGVKDMQAFVRVSNDLTNNCLELKSMHDIERLFEEAIPLVPKLHFIDSSNKKYIPRRSEILHIILIGVYPKYSKVLHGVAWSNIVARFCYLYKETIVNPKSQKK